MLTTAGSTLWFMNPPIVTKGDTEVPITATTTKNIEQKEKYIVINLDAMTLELNDGSHVLATFPILSQGKPGSYYETIGGSYRNDYKTPLHFSSIGHVYMPYSVHVFGNYFIHGIPYYPDGSPVSSTYSGGCIRLANENAKVVFDFIDRGTRIVITRGHESDFDATKQASTTLSSIELTNLMVATISLEALTQDNSITDTNGFSITTRKNILPRLVTSGDSSVANLYASGMGKEAFISAMNSKAKALGLTNTHFIDVVSPVETTYEDYERFMTHITTYKSYLRTLQNTDNRMWNTEYR